MRKHLQDVNNYVGGGSIALTAIFAIVFIVMAAVPSSPKPSFWLVVATVVSGGMAWLLVQNANALWTQQMRIDELETELEALKNPVKTEPTEVNPTPSADN